MITREMGAAIRKVQGKFPVITVTGPRQSGKTTLLKSLFPDLPYFSLETPDFREQVEQNPRELFVKTGHRMILDEVQRVPQLLSYIQTIVDEDPQAFFVLSGSHNLLMLEQVSQSLAGRAAIFYLLPFSRTELAAGGYGETQYEAHLFRGAYPRVFDRGLEPKEFYPNYLETYVQRDVRQIRNVGNLGVFTRFLSICAGHIGQSVNFSSLASAAGVNVATAKSWISILETSFILYLLNPYYRNFNKRITKAPKLYFYDTGLACSLLRINQLEAVDLYFQKGALFENWVINEVMKLYHNRGERPPLYYWRDQNQHEIDLIIDLGHALVPVEIKSGRTFSKDYFKHISWFSGISAMPIHHAFVVHGGDQDWELEQGSLLSWKGFTQRLLEMGR